MHVLSSTDSTEQSKYQNQGQLQDPTNPTGAVDLNEYHIHIASRINSSHPNIIANRAAQLRAQGIALTSLNDSNPTHHGLAPCILPEQYSANPRGSLTSRKLLAQVLADEQHRDIDPEHLMILDSTSQAYSWVITALCDPGDAVLSPAPGYPLIDSICALQAVHNIQYRLCYDGSWYVDIAALHQLCQEHPHIRALIVVNPNNPTGSYIHQSDRQALLDLCRQYQLALIADEVFFDFTLQPLASARRFAGEQSVVTLAFDGLSKRLAAPHAKVGWIELSGPEDQVRRVQTMLDAVADDYLPFSVLTECALPQLLDELSSQHKKVHQRITHNLELLQSALAHSDTAVVSLLRAEAGWNVLLQFPSSIDENELALRMLEQEHMLIQPGYFFDMTSNGFVAVSLLPEPDQFVHGIDCLLRTIDDMLNA